jgi:hypothetical protein
MIGEVPIQHWLRLLLALFLSLTGENEPTSQPMHQRCHRILIRRWKVFSIANPSPGRKAHLRQTEHPTSLPASDWFPGQLRGVVLRVCFISARPVRISVRDATFAAMSGK